MTRHKNHRASVGRRALIQRINRALAKRGDLLKTTRSDKWRNELGDYYTVDLQQNTVVEKHVELESLGRKLKVLADYERLEEEQ